MRLAAWVNVVGSSPTGGILSQICECACNAFTHSLARNFPPVGIEPGPISLQEGRLHSSETSQLGHPRIPNIAREITEHVLAITGVLFLGHNRG